MFYILNSIFEFFYGINLLNFKLIFNNFWIIAIWNYPYEF